MHPVKHIVLAGLDALRQAVLQVAQMEATRPAARLHPTPNAPISSWLATETDLGSPTPHLSGSGTGPPGLRSTGSDPDADRVAALVDLARAGDAEAFGALYDHYVGTVYRFAYYRVGARALAEDLTSETFFRALRGIGAFRWQGKDFGAWLVTIARNLIADHFKSGRYRFEVSTDDIASHDSSLGGVDDDVITGMTNEVLLEGIRQLSAEQQECIVLRFLEGMTIAETAKALDRTVGAVKQLQLRAVRNLAKALPGDLR